MLERGVHNAHYDAIGQQHRQRENCWSKTKLNPGGEQTKVQDREK
jgi:hypothetical protein